MDEYQNIGANGFQFTNSIKVRRPNSPRRQRQPSKTVPPTKYFLFRLLIQKLFKLFNAAVTIRVETQHLGVQRSRQQPPICTPSKTIGGVSLLS